MNFLMKKNYSLVIYATVFAIIFTTLSYAIPAYSPLWLSLEVIILPVIYTLGYELIIDEQKWTFSEILDNISEYSKQLEKENIKLKEENKYLKKEILQKENGKK